MDVLLRSARLVADHVAHLRLLIAGTFWRNWQHYAKLVDKYQLREVVVSRTGYIPDDEVELYFTSADLIALPYRRLDSDSGVAAMAIGFGKALIVTDVGGLPGYVLRREGLCNPGDPCDLACKITRILSDNSLREEMSQDSEILSERRSWEHIAERTLTLYRSVTNPAGAETDREDAPPTREILSGSVSGGRVSLHKQL